MKRLLKIFMWTILTSAASDMYAQVHSIYYTGYGRAEVERDIMDESSAYLQNDSLSDRRDLNGRFLFDLGVNVEPGDYLRASAILRVSNIFGGFYSQGSALEFRQVRISGHLDNKINYDIGDIDLKLTNYTLVNNDENYYQFESDVFGVRRDLIAYENFNIDDNWRLQGVNTYATLEFDKLLEKADIQLFGTRIKKNDYLTTPDRLLVGGKIKLYRSSLIKLGANIVSINDVTGTVADTAVDYNNTVMSIDYDAAVLDNDNMQVGLNGEFGNNTFDYNKFSTNESRKDNDFFYDLGATLKLKPQKLNIGVKYKYVGPRFYSPGAQSLRVDNNLDPSLFPTSQAGSLIRSVSIYDRLTDQNLYNQSINPQLMTIAPRYSNVLPYGDATPNRQGVTAKASYGNRDSLVYVEANVASLTEAIGEGTLDKRKFMLIYGGLDLSIDQLVSIDKKIGLTFGIKMENTTRDGGAPLDLSSTLIDAGLSVEIADKLDLLVGYKALNASGNEFLNTRDDFNEIQFPYSLLNVDVKENLIGGGLRYRFSRYNFATVNYNMVDYQNNINSQLDNKFNQVYFNYTLQF